MAENKWIVDGHHYTCPSCKRTMAIVVNESDEGFEFCPFCGKRMSGQTATDKMDIKTISDEDAMAAAKLIQNYCRCRVGHGGCTKDNCTFNDSGSWCNVAGMLEDWTNTPDEWELD